MVVLSKHFWSTLLLTLVIACNEKPEQENAGREQNSESLVIANAWARPAAEGTNSAAYMTIHNHTSRADTLVGITGEDVSIAELHESYEKEGMMGMRPADTLVVNSGSRIELKPGGYHVMLMQVNKQLITGDSLQLNLRFTETGNKKVMAVIQ